MLFETFWNTIIGWDIYIFFYFFLFRKHVSQNAFHAISSAVHIWIFVELWALSTCMCVYVILKFSLDILQLCSFPFKWIVVMYYRCLKGPKCHEIFSRPFTFLDSRLQPPTTITNLLHFTCYLYHYYSGPYFIRISLQKKWMPKNFKSEIKKLSEKCQKVERDNCSTIFNWFSDQKRLIRWLDGTLYRPFDNMYLSWKFFEYNNRA